MSITYLERSLLLPELYHQQAEEALLARRHRIQNTKFKYGKDFLYFGSTYFDGGETAAAYRRYQYDGRFAEGLENIEQLCSISSSAAVLELGCAKGYVLAEFYRKGYRDLTGVDISEYAVASAHSSITEKVVCSDALTFLVARKKNYHLVIIKEMLPHLSQSELNDLLSLLPERLYKDGYIYLEIQCAADEEAAALIRKFDPTHRILWDELHWRERLESSPIATCEVLVYLKNLV